MRRGRTKCVLSGEQTISIINESGLYSLVLRSKKEEAKKFKKWVTHEVLPSIRKTGMFQLFQSSTLAFVRRFNANWDRVDKGYFSVIGELFIRVHGKLEQVGYIMPDKGKDGKEMRPDVGVGKLFPKWLKEKHPSVDAQTGIYKYYKHKLPDGMEVEARQYVMDILPLFIKYIEDEWMITRATDYFKERDIKALDYLAKLLGNSV